MIQRKSGELVWEPQVKPSSSEERCVYPAEQIRLHDSGEFLVSFLCVELSWCLGVSCSQ